MAETRETMLAERALIRLAGSDVRPFLQGLITNDVTAIDNGPVWSALLTPQGKALFDFIVWADGEAALIDCEAAQAEALAKRLSFYRLRRPITIEPSEAAVHWSPSDAAGVPDPRLPALGSRWLGPKAAPARGWRNHRLGLGITEGVAELGSGETLWLECNAAELNGVSFTKGCYVGQENTARMHYRAKVNRRLVVAPIGPPGKHSRATYLDLNLMVELRRTEALGDAIVPPWLAAVLD